MRETATDDDVVVVPRIPAGSSMTVVPVAATVVDGEFVAPGHPPAGAGMMSPACPP